MNDRIKDLPLWALQEYDDNGNDLENASPNKNKGENTKTGNKCKQTKRMEHFFSQVESIEEDIEAVKMAAESIGDVNESAMQATTTQEGKELSHRLAALVDQTNKRAKQAKSKLSFLKEENEIYSIHMRTKRRTKRTKNLLRLLKKENRMPKHEETAKKSVLRIRKNLCNTLTSKFTHAMKLYHNAQQKYKADIKHKMARQIQIVKPEVTEEEIEAIVQSEAGLDAFLREHMLAGGVNDQVEMTYAKVAGKYQDILTLEQSIVYLNHMFLDFAILTEQQGEVLDKIELQVQKAGDDLEDAATDIYKSTEYQRKIRKKHGWIIVVVAIVIVVIVFAA